ncbi:peptide-methionine (S)-S-oxide reductase MsrA [Thermosynechococcaceae cyanobacterium BACA0444]|uniref:Peptide methionine sulfoxide reductase MsrA n=1 Tax=Pseudocalidococcus azoricus BACA0444 TaxID=2918990 RepID=A0AAE4FVR2_9CYAN|nr:peptide-methionine (S)-S-oxide reductase MsrA [Pseudocalidococcus azoricus]MDS3862172.1 peptide-methionine (S)-S-oxide reductase MsrA [Pseudocalidococcus azoricus BACA0444]
MLTLKLRSLPTPIYRGLIATLTVTAVVLVGFVIVRLSPPKLADIRSTVPDPVIDASMLSPTAMPSQQTAVFAGGCFWGMEALFEHVKGVSNVISGYAGGSAETATYQQVSRGGTGHAESIQITYDPSQVSYGELLKIFFTVAHDPTQLNQQGFDVGTQYRSAVFFTNAEQQKIAQAYIEQLNQAKVFYQPVVTDVQPLKDFYPAEDYHQDFVAHHPTNFYVVAVEIPKIDRFQKRFPNLYTPQVSKSASPSGV